jgi:hypothetical protein
MTQEERSTDITKDIQEYLEGVSSDAYTLLARAKNEINELRGQIAVDKQIISLLKNRIYMAAVGLDGFEDNFRFENGRVEVFCVGEWMDPAAEYPSYDAEEDESYE